MTLSMKSLEILGGLFKKNDIRSLLIGCTQLTLMGLFKKKLGTAVLIGCTQMTLNDAVQIRSIDTVTDAVLTL